MTYVGCFLDFDFILTAYDLGGPTVFNLKFPINSSLKMPDAV